MVCVLGGALSGWVYRMVFFGGVVVRECSLVVGVGKDGRVGMATATVLICAVHTTFRMGETSNCLVSKPRVSGLPCIEFADRLGGLQKGWWMGYQVTCISVL